MIRPVILAGLVAGAVLTMPYDASAITLEVARACDAQVAKAFPPRQIGNPAAGSAKGNAKQQREYFRICVANGGKMDSPSSDMQDATKR